MAGKWRFITKTNSSNVFTNDNQCHSCTPKAYLSIINHIVQCGRNHQLKTFKPRLHNCGPEVRILLGVFPWIYFLSKADIFGQDLATGGWWGPERPRACFPQTISQRSPGKTLSADLLIGGTGHLTAVQSVATHFEML